MKIVANAGARSMNVSYTGSEGVNDMLQSLHGKHMG